MFYLNINNLQPYYSLSHWAKCSFTKPSNNSERPGHVTDDVNMFPMFPFLRNRVNRERKIYRQRYYDSKVSQLKDCKPSAWWKEVKKLTRQRDLWAHLYIVIVINFLVLYSVHFLIFLTFY